MGIVSPRCFTREQAAAYCGVTPQAFDQWRREKRVPDPLPGTRRWDKKALDLALDAASGIQSNASSHSAYQDWLNARQARGHQYDQKKAA